MDSPSFESLLATHCPAFSEETRKQIIHFRDLVVAENAVQNLTRLISPEDFLEGHVIDVRELLSMSEVRFPAMDLGSGGGVPGLLAAICRPDTWILVDSEAHKARFLLEATKALGLEGRVSVFYGRGEDFLLKERVETVVCRAVGSAERIFGWIGKSSTWNSLVLFKGPKWEEEWAALRQTKWGKDVVISKEHRYELPVSGAKRVIVQLNRVPRGTSRK